MAINPETKWTPAEYLVFEREQGDAKHEYLDGRIIPMAETIRGMAGASLAHNRIVSNLVISSIETLLTYVLIAQDNIHIERFQRQESGWLLTVAKRFEASVRLEAIGCELALADVYARVL